MSAAPPAGTSLSPTARHVWSRARGLLLAAAVLAMAGVIIAAVRSSSQHGFLDPRSSDRYGTHAAARLLDERGVSTRVVTTAAQAAASAGSDTTLLVTDPDALSKRQRAKLHAAFNRGGRTVLLAPGRSSTAALAPGVRASTPTPVQPEPPDCDLPAARRAGDAEIGGFRYAPPSGPSDACYLHQGLPSLLRLPSETGDGGNGVAPDGDTVLLGSPDLLYNSRLGKHGNASLVLQLLGSRPHLVWYLPSNSEAAPPQGKKQGIFGLLPSGWTWATLQLAIAALLAALWRARRLGPLVQERLPVAVRASETAEGRARLYRRANARGRAADALRSATRARLALQLGVPSTQAHVPDFLMPAVSSHLPQDDVSAAVPSTEQPDTGPAPMRSLLFGPAPASDTELVRLADRLDALEQHITAVTSVSKLPTDKDRTS